MSKKPIIVVLDNVRSVHNVGSIFRTSDALGIDKIYLCGTTPTPTDRFGRERKDLAKVALGAEKNVNWEYVEKTKDILTKLRKQKYQIVAIEQSKNSIDYKKIKINCPTAIILGNEVSGIEREVLKLADLIVEIPMSGKKESLNVSVAFGIIGYRLLDL